jgi:ATP-dependent Clp protease protease subunit
VKFTHVLEDIEIDDEAANEAIEAIAEMMNQNVWAPGIPAYHGPSTRSVLIAGEISEGVANTVISQLMQLQADDETEPIRVYVNTVGGDAASGFALYDWMRCLTMPVIGITYGRCSSAGLPILMGADFRLAAPRTRFFYHEVIYGAPVNSRVEAEDHRQNYEWYQEQMREILTTRAKINKTKWKKNFEGVTSMHFGVDKALELGIIHDTLEEQRKKIRFGDKNYG